MRDGKQFFGALLGFVVAAGSAAGGCDGKSQPPAEEKQAKGGDPVMKADPSAKSEKAHPVAAKGGKKVKVVDGAPPAGDERYALNIETPEATAGQEAAVVVRVVPKAPWHMNLDFPTSLKVDAPDGVAVAKAAQKKDDAIKLDESTCQFDVKFTADTPGEQTFTGKFKFAVCQDEACAPVTEDVEFKVAVK